MNKIDLILQEVQNIGSKMNEKFEKIDEKFNEIGQKFAEIDHRLDGIDHRLDGIDTRITKLKADNLEEHQKIFKLLNSLNNSFLKHEIETNDKIKILFDANTDHMNRRDIYNHELTTLNDTVANHSVRIANLEQQNKQFDTMNQKKSKRLSLKENIDNFQKILEEKPPIFET